MQWTIAQMQENKLVSSYHIVSLRKAVALGSGYCTPPPASRQYALMRLILDYALPFLFCHSRILLIWVATPPRSAMVYADAYHAGYSLAWNDKRVSLGLS